MLRLNLLFVWYDLRPRSLSPDVKYLSLTHLFTKIQINDFVSSIRQEMSMLPKAWKSPSTLFHLIDIWHVKNSVWDTEVQFYLASALSVETNIVCKKMHHIYYLPWNQAGPSLPLSLAPNDSYKLSCSSLDNPRCLDLGNTALFYAINI